MEAFKFYEVGGKIRDEFLGLTNKDVDYVAVPNTDDTMLLEYYAEDGEILDRRYDDIDYQELVDILEPEYFKGSDNNPTEEKPLWTSEY